MKHAWGALLCQTSHGELLATNIMNGTRLEKKRKIEVLRSTITSRSAIWRHAESIHSQPRSLHRTRNGRCPILINEQVLFCSSPSTKPRSLSCTALPKLRPANCLQILREWGSTLNWVRSEERRVGKECRDGMSGHR